MSSKENFPKINIVSLEHFEHKHGLALCLL